MCGATLESPCRHLTVLQLALWHVPNCSDRETGVNCARNFLLFFRRQQKEPLFVRPNMRQ
jgi:hypothetical protein